MSEKKSATGFVILVMIVVATSFAGAAPQPELPGRLFEPGPQESSNIVELTGVVRVVGDARSASPALVLNEEGIQLAEGASLLGLIGPGTEELMSGHQGEELTLRGRIISRDEYRKDYANLYPVGYLLFQGYFLVGEADESMGTGN